jgi:hypothetical protein
VGNAERDEQEEKLQDKQRQQGWNRDPIETGNKTSWSGLESS